VVRDGKNDVKGRMLGLLLGLIGKRVLGKELEKTVKAIEARNEGARAPEPTERGIREWRDPDSNWGHHDFQTGCNLRASFPEARAFRPPLLSCRNNAATTSSARAQGAG
jgi:hypothetical protein